MKSKGFSGYRARVRGASRRVGQTTGYRTLTLVGGGERQASEAVPPDHPQPHAPARAPPRPEAEPDE